MGESQGSIFGLLLFFIFINDLPLIDANENNLTMYANENTYLCYETTMNKYLEKMQKMIITFYDWFSNNKMCLNAKKTVFIDFGPRTTIQNESFLRVAQKSIEQVEIT